MIIAEDDAAALADGYPHLMTNLNLKDEMIAELVGRQRDVFTAACGDQRSGLHGPKGKPCPARPWVCLLCPLAVFAPRPWHAANLLRLKAFFSRQWQQMPAAQFMAAFGLYATRIQQVLDRFEPAVLAAAGAQAANRDHELPLRPEELTGWPPHVSDGRSAVFARAVVCREAGLTLPTRARRPVFEDGVRDFTHVVRLSGPNDPVHTAVPIRLDLRSPLAAGRQGTGAGHARSPASGGRPAAPCLPAPPCTCSAAGHGWTNLSDSCPG
ncbi:hypothetical protein ABZU86_34695 [Streptomyces sp. NPDC005271]|uniref:hypothetical protein n=1 Tax=unclassified Streptomyces TaxID=2593676 RepID=UPI0033B44F31